MQTKEKLLELPIEKQKIPSYWWCKRDRIKIPYHHETGAVCCWCGKRMAAKELI